MIFKLTQQSHASRVRGLKQVETSNDDFSNIVARFPRAWIETTTLFVAAAGVPRRTLPACVD